MSLHSVPRLNSARRRARKAQLAARDGWRCAYCRTRFKNLGEATMDHIVPYSLHRTWSANALVLACWPCNQTKSDRLFLSIALLLVWSTDPTFTSVQPTTNPAGPVGAGADGSTAPELIRFGPQDVDWLMLARLVQARSRAERSTPEQAKARKPVARRVRVGRVEHTRRTARMNTCEQSTDREARA
ncbi:HNH endonuclease [Streptomyces hydrogenans]|uniref:HNH endonuclease n=1 Tax=Streptomyces hydrogenans TaxID=1873719 RepID=UPI0036B075DC